jgi:hypothetical protein
MKLIDRIRKNKIGGLTAGIIICAGSLFLFFKRITQEEIHSKNDLKFVTGQLRDYHFFDGLRGLNYTFRLIGFSRRIQIVADFRYLFNDKEFRKLNYGDSITIGLSKKGHEQLHDNNQGRIIAYSINNSSTFFLDPDKVLKDYNTRWSIYLSLLLFIVGCHLLYVVYKVYHEQPK